MISVEFFNPSKHYEIVGAWWKAQEWQVIPLSHLPQTGIIVTCDGKPAAAAWIFKTDSAFCWLEFIVADPAVRGEIRSSVLSVLISSAKMLAKSMGFLSVFTSTNHASLMKRIETHGFTATDQSVNHYHFDLKGGC